MREIKLFKLPTTKKYQKHQNFKKSFKICLNTCLMPVFSNSELLTPLAPQYHAGNVQKLSIYSSFWSKVDRMPSNVGSERLSSSWGMMITLRRRWLSLVSQIVLPVKRLWDVRYYIKLTPTYSDKKCPRLAE